MAAEKPKISDLYPLTPLQAGMLFHTIYDAESLQYIEQFTCRLNGNLNLDAMQKAWQLLVDQYDVLRISILWETVNKPLQKIHTNVTIPWNYEDLTNNSAEVLEEKINITITQEQKKSIDLHTPPLMRLKLLKTGKEEYVLIWTHHHILLDGWSVPIVIRQVLQNYEALLEKKPLPQIHLASSYKDYIVWLLNQDKAKNKNYWEGELKGFDTPSLLGLEKYVGESQDKEYGKTTLEIPRELTEKLKYLAKSQGLTLSAILQGIWGILLSHYSNDKDVVFGSTVAGRPTELRGIEDQVGLFINTLPIRVKIDGKENKLNYLKRFHATFQEIQDHGYVPLWDIQSWSTIRKSGLFNHIFVFENYPVEGIHASDSFLQKMHLTISDVKTIEHTNYPLTIVASEQNSQIKVRLDYAKSSYDLKPLNNLLNHYKNLLEQFINRPDEKLEEITLLTDVEQKQILHEWNNTRSEYPKEKTIHELFEEQAEKIPNHVAVVFENQQLTYKELNERSNQLAHYLKKKGVKSDTLVAVYMERSLELMITLLGILKAGGAYVPLDPDYPKDRLEYMLGDSQAKILVTQKNLREHLPVLSTVALVDIEKIQQELNQESTLLPKINISSKNLAYVIYTSGSTGKPKGTGIPHSNVHRLLTATQAWYQFNEKDVWTLFHSYAFDFSIWELWGGLLHGGKVIVVPYFVSRSPKDFYELLKREKVTVLNQTPSAFIQLIDYENQDTEKRDALDCLRYVIFGGEALNPALLAPWYEHHPTKPLLINMYGITETTVHVTYRKLDAQAIKTGRSEIGRQIPDLQTYIVDDKKHLVPEGITGELYVGGAGLARSYLNRPDLTAERFIANPFATEEDVKVGNTRLYKTGDLCRWLSDGNIEYVGRIDHQVKIRGFRIELGEIESALSNHDQIKEVAVLAREDEPGQKRLVAYYVVKDPAFNLTIADLRDYLSKSLPDYMIPSVFVALEQMPLTQNGKLDRKALPIPEIGASEGYVAPNSLLEQQLVEIWENVLQASPIGIRDNFFERGGHSLLATQVVSRIRTTLKRELSLQELFKKPTIEEIANYLRRESVVATLSEIKVISRNQPIPLSYAQQRLWFIDQLEPGSAQYNIPVTLRLKGELNVGALEEALNKVIERHEVLRTTFVMKDGEAYQVIAPELKLTLNVEKSNEEQAKQKLIAEVQKGFELSKGPLIRTRLFKASSDTHLFLLNVHHSVSDGWSMGIMAQEIGLFYESFIHRTSIHLKALPIQYADFSVWQRDYLSKDKPVYEKQLSYWQEELSDSPRLLELPLDHARPAVRSGRGESIRFELSKELTAELKRISHENEVTLFMTLLTSFYILLWRYSGQDDIVIGSPIANRHREEVEGLIGFFVNTLGLRGKINPKQSFIEFLKIIKHTTLMAYENQDMPFEQLVDHLKIERSLSQSPLFQVMFVLQNNPEKNVHLTNLELQIESLDYHIAQFDLMLRLNEDNDNIIGDFEYANDLFERETIEKLVKHFEILLNGIIKNPKGNLRELPILTKAEEHQILYEWNDTNQEYSKAKKIHELFEEQAKKMPNNIAVVFEDQRLTYKELNEQSNQLAYYLRKQGVKADVLVAVCMERSLELIIALLGILKAGGAYVPLDPDLPTKRLETILTQASVVKVLTQEHWKKRLSFLPSTQVLSMNEDVSWKLSHTKNLEIEIHLFNLCYTIYTSGSTGEPKGVPNTHGGLLNRLLWMQNYCGLKEEDRVLQKTPYTFDVSVWEFFLPLITGARLVIAKPEGHKDPGYIANVIEEQQISLLHFVPSMLQVFLEHTRDKSFYSLKRVVTSGEALLYGTRSEFLSRFNNVKLTNLYGPTEASIDVTYWDCEREEPQGIVPIGKGIWNTQLYIQTSDYELVPETVIGELYLGGVGLARGYLSRPDLTAEKFIANPFATEEDIKAGNTRIYKTGDLCRWLEDGNIEYVGRIDYQVKIHGFRIELGEIESALSNHEKVKEAIVLAREDEPEQKRLVAYYVLKEKESTLSISELKDYLSKILPGYMVPSAFMALEAMPLTSNGKLDRKGLPAPEYVRVEFTAARNEIEEKLVAIWQSVLHVESVSVLDNFFELGGDSIISIQMISRANEQGMYLKAKDIFQSPTIAGLAHVVQERSHQQLRKSETTGKVPLSAIQHWFFESEYAEPSHWNQSLLLKLPKEIQVEFLQEILRAAFKNHPNLFMRYDQEGQFIIQHYGAIQDVRIESILLTEKDKVKEQERIANELQGSLNLSEGPLFRIALFEGHTDQQLRLLLIIHHLVIDGVSWRILLEEIQKGYEQRVKGEEIHLTPERSSFKDYEKALIELTETKEIQEQKDYWLSQPETKVLPKDHDGEATQERIVTEEMFLSERETEQLLRKVPQAYHTQINDILLTVLVLALKDWTGEKEATIHLEGHGREELIENVDLSGTVGWFTSLYPVYLSIPSEDLDETIKQIKEQLRSIPLKGIGYGLLKYLGKDEELKEALKRKDKHQIIFNYLGQLDREIREEGLFAGVNELTGKQIGIKNHVNDVLSINGEIVGGQLRLGITYSREHYEPKTIQRLINAYQFHIKNLLVYCVDENHYGYTPSDFSLVKLTQEQLDKHVDRNVEDIYPQTPMQKGMLFHTLYDASRGDYVEQMVYQLSGEINPTLLRQAWEGLLQQYPILRTSFWWEELEDFLQVVHKEVELPWIEEKIQGTIEDYLKKDREQGFDIKKAPLMRLVLLNIKEKDYVLIWTYHHMLLDGWSSPIVMGQVLENYAALLEKKTFPQLKGVDQYRNYVEWLLKQDRKSNENYWRNELRGFDTPTHLGFEKRVGEIEKTKFGEERLIVSSKLMKELSELTKSHGLTLSAVVQGLWGILLSRYSGNDDVIFGSTVSGRPAELTEIEKQVGLFINTLPIRVQLKKNETRLEYLKRFNHTFQNVQEYGYVPLWEIQEWSDVAKDTQLFNHILVYENYPIEKLKESGSLLARTKLSINEVKAVEQTNYPLVVSITETEGQLSVKLDYAESHYDRESLRGLLKHFEHLIEEIVKAPEKKVGEINLLTEEERKQILYTWNDTKREYPKYKTIHELYEEQARKTPTDIAVVFEDRKLTYKELSEKSNQLAQYLKKQGLKADTLIAVCMERSLELIIVLLGILKAGAAYVPLDPEYPKDRLEYMLEDSKAKFIITQEKLKNHLPMINSVEEIIFDDIKEKINQEAKTVPAVILNPNNLAYVIYTSGSTGNPKGVQVSHLSIADHLHWHVITFNDENSRHVFLHQLSFSFDGGTLALWWPLASGNRVVLSKEAGIGDIKYLSSLIEKQEITLLHMVPSMMALLIEELGQDKLSTVKLMTMAGEKLSNELAQKLLNEYPAVGIYNCYGPTENAVTASFYHLSENEKDIIPIGKGISNVHLYLLDNDLELSPVGIANELYIGGSGLARGYFNRPDLTAERFVANPFATEEDVKVGNTRLYKTGDLCRWLSDGNIEYVGRIDHQVKIRGFRIELGEIETALSNHEQIKEAVVLAREDQPGQKRLVAYYVLKDSTVNLIVADLWDYLSQSLPDYMLPSAFVALEQMPLTQNGKLDRKALPIPEMSGSEGYIAPSRLIEQQLVEIWEDVLHVSPIGIRDNFFELGGHSLLATQVVSRIRTRLKRELPLHELFKKATIEEIGNYLEKESEASQLTPIIPINRAHDIPLSYAQQRLWFLDQLEPGNAHYNIPVTLRLEGKLNVGVLEQALNAVIERHEVLRTTFVVKDSEAYQVISPELKLTLSLEESSEEQAIEQLAKEVQKGFELSKGPLIRTRLFKVSSDTHLFLLNVHHSVSDGWSMGVMAQEIGLFYESFIHRTSIHLKALPIQYADFSVWQRDYLSKDKPVYEKQLSYWQEELSDSPRLLELPLDHARPAVRSGRGESIRFELSKELTAELKRISHENEVTLFMTLLTSFYILLWRYSGQDDIVIGSPIANRHREEVEGLIGFFVNTLALRGNINPKQSFIEFLKTIKHTTLMAYENQDMPFEQLVDHLKIERSLSHSPLFQVMFVLQNNPEKDIHLTNLKLGVEPLNYHISKFDLTLTLWEEKEKLAAEFEYASDLFERETIERLVNHFEILVESIIKAPENKLHELPLLTKAETQQILYEWNDTKRDYPKDKTIHELFEERVKKAPKDVAIVFEEQQLTYEELNEKSNQFANYLQRQGVKADTLVAVCMDRSLELIIVLLGILKSGGAYVPLDPEYPKDRLAYMLEDSKANLLITQSNLKKHLPIIDSVTEVIFDEKQEEIEQELKTTPQVILSPKNLAYVIYTSGSTGKPKGVQIAHISIVDHVYWHVVTFNDENSNHVFLHQLSFSFDGGTLALWWPLLAGNKLILAKEAGVGDLGYLSNLIEKQEISILHMVPSMMDLLVGELGRERLSTVKLLTMAGERLPKELGKKLWNEYSDRGIYNCYGPTENAVTASFYEFTGKESEVIPIGKGISNVALYVMDENTALSPVGVANELYVGGNGLARGYLNRPDLTAEKFIANPYATEEDVRAGNTRLYRTGDLCRWLSDGNIEYVGRIDHQVKIRGFRIELGEIETALSNHKQIKEAVVLAREDEPGQKRLVAYYVLKEKGSALSVSELKDVLNQSLPDYMVPSVFMTLEAMPLTPNGKLDRKGLPAPEYVRVEFTAARNEIEAKLVEIWQKVLHVDSVSVLDNFFELGGDSIISIQMISRANEQGMNLKAKDIFQSPTIAGLALVVTERKNQKLRASETTGEVPLSAIQHWFFESGYTVPSHWNQSLLLKLPKNVNRKNIEESLKASFQNHPNLFIRYDQEGKLATQHYGAIQDVEIKTILLTEKDKAKEQEKISNELQGSLNLEQGPLFRIAFFQGHADDQLRLLLIIHHLVVDGVSWRILLEEIQKGYEQRVKGEEITLIPEHSSFKDWEKGLIELTESDLVQNQREYWLSQPETRALPKDTEGTMTQESLVSEKIILNKIETEQLLREVPQAYHTQINDILLTGLVLALRDWTGERETTIHLEGHGREELIEDVDISRTVGWFTSMYPVYLSIPSDNLGETIKHIKEQLRTVPHKGIGYGLLRYLGKDHELSEALKQKDKHQIVFNYLGQLDIEAQEKGLFVGAGESSGREIGIRNNPSEVLSINGSIVGGILELGITYCCDQYNKETIQKFKDSYQIRLKELISYCRDEKHYGYTPSDFELVKLTQEQLDQHVDRSVEDIYPQTPMQKGMLFHTLYDANRGDYVEQMVYRLSGELNTQLLRQAWEGLIQQYPILRTSFWWEGLEEFVQVVHEKVELPWIEIPLHGMSEKEIEEYLRKDRVEGFDVKIAPPMRISLLKRGSKEHVLVWTFHHMLLDGWSGPIVMGQVLKNYEKLLEKKSLAKLEGMSKYKTYVEWLLKQDKKLNQNYWQEELKGFYTSTNLGFEKITGAIEKPSFEKITLELSKELTHEMKILGARNGLTLSDMSQGIWGLLLSCYSGSDDVVFGSTVSGRPAEIGGIEKQVGLFINTLPIRVKIRNKETYLEYLKRFHKTFQGVQEHGYVPLWEIQGWSELEKKEKLFNHIVVYENYPVEGIDGRRGLLERIKLSISEVNVVEQTNYPLVINITEIEGKLSLKLDYAESNYAKENLQRLLKYYKHLLQEIITHPEEEVGETNLLTEEERTQILYAWNDTKREYPKDKTVPELFENQAKKTPNHVAVVFEKQELTYKELNEKSNQLAHYLKNQGVKADKLVAVCMERSLELMIALLGILKAGGAYVPLDPDSPEKRLATIVSQASPVKVLTQAHLKERLSFLPSAQVLVLDEAEAWKGMSLENLNSALHLDNLCYTIYTSGSTGEPKGVPNVHGGLLNRLLWMQSYCELKPEDRVLQKTPYTFDVSVWELFLPLITGARLVFAKPEGHKDPGYLAEVIEEQQISLLHFVPSMLQVFLDHTQEKSCSSLKRVVTSGEALSYGTRTEFLNRFKEVHLTNLYGPTEASIDVTYWDCGREEPQGLVPIGKGIWNTQLYIQAPDYELVPQAVVGELYLGGVGLARGYLNRPDLTAERFIANPHATEEDVRAGNTRLYRTGDLCRWLVDGNIEYVGRIDHQVKIRGFRIELGEIESSLLSHEQIKEAIVLAREDEPGQKRLVAYYVLKNPTLNLTTEALRDYLSQSLPDYMIPSAFMVLEAMPLTSNGKLDRKGLPAPEYVRTEFTAARNEIEAKLVEIWQKVLHVDSVSVLDNFFELGGDSIISIQMISRANEQGMNLKAKDIFQSPTIAGLALVVTERKNQKLRASETTGEVPLSAIQHWFFESGYTEPSHWNQSLLLKLPKNVNKENIEAALKSAFQNHPNLFMQYRKEKEEVIQHYETKEEIEIETIYLREGDKEKEQERKANELQGSLNIEKGPLFRIALFDGHTDDQLRLLMIIHHLVVDGVSWRILLEEIQKGYEQKSKGEEIKLTSELSSFKDWEKALIEFIETKEIQEQKDYWLSQPETKALPKDKEGEATQKSIAAEEILLSQKETEQLLREVPQAYHTQVNDILLTGLVLALRDWTGEKETTIHLEGHGREELIEDVDVSRTVGWFTSLYPVYLSIPSEDLGETIKHIKEQLRAVPLKGIGYGLLKYLGKNEELKGALKRKDKHQVIFNYLGQLDKEVGEEGLFGRVNESKGREIGIKNNQNNLLNINGWIMNDQLMITIGYSSNRYEAETIKQLARSYTKYMKELIAYCIKNENSGYTPSDFNLMNLTQKQIDQLFE